MDAVRVITCTPDELRALIREELSRVQPVAGPEKSTYTTEQAAEYLAMTPNALRHHVKSGNIRPDLPGQRGRTREHRFLRSTLDAFRTFRGGSGG